MAKRFLNLFNCVVLVFCTPILVSFDRWLWDLGSTVPFPEHGEPWLLIPTYLIFLVAALRQFFLMISKDTLSDAPFSYVALATLGHGLWPICSYVIFAVIVKIVIVFFPSTLGWDPWALFGIFLVWFAVTDPTLFKGAIAVIGILFALFVSLLRL